MSDYSEDKSKWFMKMLQLERLMNDAGFDARAARIKHDVAIEDYDEFCDTAKDKIQDGVYPFGDRCIHIEHNHFFDKDDETDKEYAFTSAHSTIFNK